MDSVNIQNLSPIDNMCWSLSKSIFTVSTQTVYILFAILIFFSLQTEKSWTFYIQSYSTMHLLRAPITWHKVTLQNVEASIWPVRFENLHSHENEGKAQNIYFLHSNKPNWKTVAPKRKTKGLLTEKLLGPSITNIT